MISEIQQIKMVLGVIVSLACFQNCSKAAFDKNEQQYQAATTADRVSHSGTAQGGATQGGPGGNGAAQGGANQAGGNQAVGNQVGANTNANQNVNTTAQTNACGIYPNGSTWQAVTGVQGQPNPLCPGSSTLNIEIVTSYQCVNGVAITTGSGSGKTVSQNGSCPSDQVIPMHCTDRFHAVICKAYHDLFNRYPDEAGADYWVDDFKRINAPESCWTRYISFGTQPADCETHKSIFGFYPNSPLCPASPRGDSAFAAPRAECSF